MELHPSAFVETGSCTQCDGPRYIREQPSRSSNVQGSGTDAAGPIETSEIYGPDPRSNYLTEWSIDLPYKNLLEYSNEMRQQWSLLNKEQKDIVSNNFSLFVMENPEVVVGLPSLIKGNEELKDKLIRNLALNTEGFANRDLKTIINENPSKNVPESLDILQKEYSIEFNKWILSNKYSKLTEMNIFVAILVCILFILIGIGIGYKIDQK